VRGDVGDAAGSQTAAVARCTGMTALSAVPRPAAAPLAAVPRPAAAAPLAFSLADSPIGTLLLLADAAGLRGLYMEPHALDPAWRRDDAALRDAREQLEAYFAGRLREFDLELAPVGTPFQLRVWAALREIPYGETTSYGALAARLGKPGAARAVGLANGRNPISVIVPCHRVIGADGTLTGFGGGLDRKRTLLAHEAEVLGAGVRATLW
jgi:methylated-DNA-[protein]-cysteine S-methyltransferase